MKSLWIAALSFTGAALASAEDQRVVRITPEDARLPSEVSVAINPARPDNVVAVSLQRGEPTADVAYVSFDGGATWVSVSGPNPGARTQGDDGVVFDVSGRCYWSYIAFTGLREERPKSATNGIFVNHSEDGGRLWSAPVAVVDHLNTLSPFEDKPSMATAGDGRVYVAWTRFSKYGSADPRETTHIYFSLSENGGESFAAPFRVSDVPGDAIDSDGTLEGVVPAVGIDGEVYVVWSGPQGLVLDRSTDGGWTFGEDRVLGPHHGGWDIDVEGLGRANGMPVTGVDRSGGVFRGSVYVTWVDDRNGDPDVFVTFSRDHGETWVDPVQVNDTDPAKNGAVQFFPWMAVDPEDGSVNVVYYDRSGTEGTRTGVTLSRSVDGGAHFESYPVDIEPFETNPDVFFGDYLGIDAFGGKVVAAFTHFTSSSELALSAALFDFREEP